MSEKKQTSSTSTNKPGQPATATSTSTTSTRKAWVKKTPVDVVLEQIATQEDRVNDLREELKKEERELQKLQQAKKVLEAS
jgi:hypothetical protein